MSLAYPKMWEAAGAEGRAQGARAAALSLDSLPVGAPARVVAVEGSGAVARRLMEMGVVPGAPVRVVRVAPLGDPLEVRVRNYHLALRRTEAQTILVVTADEKEREQEKTVARQP
ncbi:MAG TPA: FeoA family protein [Pyrinomonadaceae bacterium]|nr:FeoA family protein [Pyrinomonadaceae bacterium]